MASELAPIGRGSRRRGRRQPRIDMTPMVDLGFLLLVFFLLMAKFRPYETVEVTLPTSTVDGPIGDSDWMVISISDDGRVFFSVDSKATREQMLRFAECAYNLRLTEAQTEAFGTHLETGVGIASLGAWLGLDLRARKQAVNSPGIPIDPHHNELKDWIGFARLANPTLNIAVNADEDAKWPVVRRVIETLQDQKIGRFRLRTGNELL